MSEILRLMTFSEQQQRGLVELLVDCVEGGASDAGKSLLVLDTANGEAERLYSRLGWQRVGVIPGFALWPGGGLCDTTYFYRQLG